MPTQPTQRDTDEHSLFTQLVVFLKKQPAPGVSALRERHHADRYGCCAVCVGADSTGHHRWPCTIWRATSAALKEGLHEVKALIRLSIPTEVGEMSDQVIVSLRKTS